MASIHDLLGLSPQGLGANVSGIMAMEDQALQQQRGLADLMTAQRQQRAADIQAERDLLTLAEERQMQPSKIAAGIAGNEAKAGEAALAKQQQFGQMLTQFGPALGNVPEAQRGQVLQQMAQRIPGIDQDPTFQRLLNTNPRDLPLAIKSLGTDILLNTGEQMRAMALQKAKDEAAMARTQVGEAGASARTAATLANQRELEKLRIEAGKYASKKAATDPATVASKMGFEKAAVYYSELARQAEKAGNTEDAMEFRQASEMMQELRRQDQIARTVPGTTVGPGGQLQPNLPMGARLTQPQAAPPARRVIKSGVDKKSGRRVVQYEDGTIEYAD